MKGSGWRPLASILLLAVAIAAVLVFADGANSTGTSHESLEQVEARSNDAEARVRSTWTFSEYALERMPAEIASGQWSATSNLMYCNLNLYRCAEVDFEIPSAHITNRWILSYAKDSGRYCCLRTLNDSTTLLFTQIRSLPQDEDDRVTAMIDESSTPSNQAIETVKREYRINADRTPSHTGEPLPSNGKWSVKPTTEEEMCVNRYRCFQVAYTVDVWNEPVISWWDVAHVENGTFSVFKRNKEAEFYFVHVEPY